MCAFFLHYVGDNSSSYYASLQEREQYYEDSFQELYEFVEQEQVESYMSQWRLMLSQKKSEAHIRAWLEDIKQQNKPRIVGHQACLKYHKYLVTLDPRSRRHQAAVEGCDMASYPYDYSNYSYLPALECSK